MFLLLSQFWSQFLYVLLSILCLSFQRSDISCRQGPMLIRERFEPRSHFKSWLSLIVRIQNGLEVFLRYTPPASISLAICWWCDICIFNVRNKDVVVVVVVSGLRLCPADCSSSALYSCFIFYSLLLWTFLISSTSPSPSLTGKSTIWQRSPTCSSSPI